MNNDVIWNSTASKIVKWTWDNNYLDKYTVVNISEVFSISISFMRVHIALSPHSDFKRMESNIFNCSWYIIENVAEFAFAILIKEIIFFFWRYNGFRVNEFIVSYIAICCRSSQLIIEAYERHNHSFLRSVDFHCCEQIWYNCLRIIF